jgi:LPS export ABC transporter protein LptC
MMQQKSQKISCLSLVAAMLLAILLGSCSEDKKEIMSSFTDPNEVPTIFSKDVSTLISDSGITRYRIVAPEWYMYENAEVPRWYLPKGVKLENFDDDFNVIAYLEGDTAIFYKTKRLWELRGDVKMANVNDERFFTERIYWSQDAKKIYSDTVIHIEQGDRIIVGKGFESNQNMTSYKILKTTGIFPMEDIRRKDTTEYQTPDTLEQYTTIKVSANSDKN